jgi:hypothetical protein
MQLTAEIQFYPRPILNNNYIAQDMTGSYLEHCKFAFTSCLPSPFVYKSCLTFYFCYSQK